MSSHQLKHDGTKSREAACFHSQDASRRPGACGGGALHSWNASRRPGCTQAGLCSCGTPLAGRVARRWGFALEECLSQPGLHTGGMFALAGYLSQAGLHTGGMFALEGCLLQAGLHAGRALHAHHASRRPERHRPPLTPGFQAEASVKRGGAPYAARAPRPIPRPVQSPRGPWPPLPPVAAEPQSSRQ